MIRPSDVSVTRPANVTAYTAGDVMGHATGNALEFFTEANGRIRGAVFIDSTAEVTKPEFDLFLFDAEPTVADDNAAFAPTDAQMKRLVGVISFLAANFKVGGANGATILEGRDLPYFAPDRKLYGVMVARNAYVPVSEEEFTLRLMVEPN